MDQELQETILVNTSVNKLKEGRVAILEDFSKNPKSPVHFFSNILTNLVFLEFRIESLAPKVKGFKKS